MILRHARARAAAHAGAGAATAAARARRGALVVAGAASSSSSSSSSSAAAAAAASSSSAAAAPAASPPVFLVTGSSDGIGRHTAEQLARRVAGATVLVHGRSPQRVADAVAAVDRAAARANGGGGGGRAQGFVADLSRMADVRRLAAEVAAANPSGITALALNAGVFEETHSTSADGYEMTYAVNVLSPFLLAALLWRRVAERVVVTSSISASGGGALDVGRLQQQGRGGGGGGLGGYSAHAAYSASKACNQVFAVELSRRLAARGSGVRVATLDPGTVNTKMLRAGWGSCGIDVRDADNTLQLLTCDAADLSGGGSGTCGCGYFVGGRASRPVAAAADAALRERLWALWEQQTGVTFFDD